MLRRALSSLVGVLLVTTAVTAVVVVPPAAHAEAPVAPEGLTPAGGELVEGMPALAWQRPVGATRFDVEVSTTSDFATVLVTKETVNLRYVPQVQLPSGELWWRVRGVSGSVDGSWATDSFMHAPPQAPAQVQPVTDDVIDPPVDSPRFTWLPVAGATSYTIQVGGDPEFVDPALIVSSTQKTTAAVMTGYQLPGTYYWRVRAELTSGYATPWSAARPYSVTGLDPAVQPTAPANSFGPEVVDVVLDWEPIPGAVSYELEVGTDNGFLTVAHDATTVATRYAAPKNLLNDEYYWRVRPVDASGNKGAWPAELWTFRRAWSEQPTRVHPSGTVPSGTPFYFQWDALERASKYEVFLYNALGTFLCKEVTVYTTLAGTCRPTVTGDYLWRVRGINDVSNGNDTTVTLAQPPVAFHYDKPVTPTATSGLTQAMVTGQATSMSGTTSFGPDRDVCTASLADDPVYTCENLRQVPVLTWDPVPGAVQYRVSFSFDGQLTNPVSGFTDLLATETMWTPTKSLPDSQAGSAYFWLVRPCWGTALSACADVALPEHSFAKKSVGPLLSAPAAEAVVANDVTLDWLPLIAAERDPAAAVGSALRTPSETEAKDYQVQVATDPQFANLIEQATVEHTTWTSDSTTYPEGPLYWRVRAYDGSNNPTVWSEVRSFVKRSPVPQLLSPVNRAELGADYTLSWTPLDFAAAYEVEVYAGATKVAGHLSWKHAAWAPSDPFPVSAEPYTWRVRRIDARNRKGDWSETGSFVMGGFPPSVTAPEVDAVVPPSTSLFTWLPDPRATSYRFERRKPGTTSLIEPATTRATAWAPTTAIAAGTWEWRVVALDTKGIALGASAWRPFSVIDPPATSTPTGIGGSPTVGAELTAVEPVFDPPAESVTYQWYRGATPIAGATGTTYTTLAGDLGKAVSVRATGSVAGYRPAVSPSPALTIGPGDAPVAETQPVVTGTPTVGQTLGITPGSWPPGARLTYQWYRSGTAIAGADDSTYRLVVQDAGRPVHVVEKATFTGRAPGTAESPMVRVAKLASTMRLSLSPSPTTTTRRTNAAAQVAAPGLAAPGGTVKFFDGTREVGRVRLGGGSTALLRLPRLSAGRHTIRVTYGGTAYVGRASATAPLRVTRS